MTLNEKFDKATDGWIVAHACEQIADDYAIEFAVWFIEHKEFNKSKTTKELLEIFKKEKGL
jgi:hypothetical protein